MDNRKNYYEILKVSPLASPSTIKKSYQRLARIHHPDKNKNNPEAAEIFKQINEAYEILSNTFKRKDFDRQLKEEKEQKEREKEKASFSPMYENYHSYAPFSQQAGEPSFQKGPAPSQQGQKVKQEAFQKTSSSLNNQQIYGQLEISLEEAAFGCKKKISLKRFQGQSPKAEKLTVSIPAGIKENQNLKITNDITMTIVYKKHPLFTTEGENILLSLPVPFTRAMLGGSVTIPTLTGQVSFQLPPNTHGGHIIQLKGQGLPISDKSKQRGKMAITILIDIPVHFTEQEKEWIKEIQKRNQLCPKVSEFDIKTKLFLKQRKK